MRKSRGIFEGYTVSELVTVIVVIGILSTISFVSYNGLTARSRDVSVLSDVDRMDALQTSYGLKHDGFGKKYYSAYGSDDELGFSVSEGNIVSVNTNTDGDYCIRGYNVGGTKNTMDNAFSRESGAGVCDDLPFVPDFDDPGNLDYDALPLGTSISGYWTSPPDGYLFEDGTAVLRDDYPDLFNLIGETYGEGDNVTTFNLPDSRGRIEVNKSSDAEFLTVGQKYGEKTHLLTGGESRLSAHTHTVASVSSATHNHQYYFKTSGTTYKHEDFDAWQELDGVLDSFNTATMSGVSNHSHSFTVSSVSANASSSHNNIQPTIVKRYAIKTTVPTSSDSELPAGTSISGYFSSQPTGYLYEDGSAKSCVAYAALATALGVTSCTTTFTLPDSRGRTPVNLSSTDTEFDALGEESGEKAHTLASGESGQVGHNHSASSTTDTDSHTHGYVREDYDYVDYSGTTYGHPKTGVGPTFGNLGNVTTTSDPSHTHTVTVDTTGLIGASAHNEIQPSITKTFVIKYTPAATSEYSVKAGTSIHGYWATEPEGYLFEDGGTELCADYPNLARLFGTTGCTNFDLPDSRGRVSVNVSSTDTDFDTIGELYGVKSLALTIAQTGLPSHSHTTSSTADTASHTHSYLYERRDYPSSWEDFNGHIHLTTVSRWFIFSRDYYPSSGGPTHHSHTISLNAAASYNATVAHSNIQPSITQNFAIKY